MKIPKMRTENKLIKYYQIKKLGKNIKCIFIETYSQFKSKLLWEIFSKDK